MYVVYCATLEVMILKTENLFTILLLYGNNLAWLGLHISSFYTVVCSGVHGHGKRKKKKEKKRKEKKKKDKSCAGDVYVEDFESGMVMVILLHTYTYVLLALVYFVYCVFFFISSLRFLMINGNELLTVS